MLLTEKLDFLMDLQGLNQRQLSLKSGVKYTTIRSIYENGYENMKLSNLKKFADFFGVTLDYLARDEITVIEYYIPLNPVDANKDKLLSMYNQLSKEGRAKLIERGSELIDLGYTEKGDVEKMA